MSRVRRRTARAVLLLLLLLPRPSAGDPAGTPPAAVATAAVAAPGELVQSGDVDGGADLAWSPPPGGADGYILFIDRTGRGEYYEFTRCREPKFRVVGLKNGATYGFRVAAQRGGAVSPMSNAVRVTPFDLTPPPRPEGLTARAERHAILLDWRAVDAADFLHYTVYRRAEGESRFMPLEDDTGLLKPGFTDRQVSPGTRYVYRVTASDRAGNESRRSEGVEARTLARAHLSFSLFDRKLYAYCYNPNDRTLFLSYAYEENLARWAAWRRVGFDLAPPDEAEDSMNCFAVTRTARGGRAVAVFPASGELYERDEEESERWGPWRHFASAGGRLAVAPGRSAQHDARFHQGKLLVAAFDPHERDAVVHSTRDGRAFDPPRRYPARLPMLVGETSEVHLSLLALSGEVALIAAHVPGTRRLARFATARDATTPVEVVELSRDFPPPPNL